MFNKLKQIKELREKAKKVQGALKDKFAEGSGGWGKVKVTISGNQEVTAVTIDPEFCASETPEKIGIAVRDATNDALKKVQRLMVEQMQAMGELKI